MIFDFPHWVAYFKHYEGLPYSKLADDVYNAGSNALCDMSCSLGGRSNAERIFLDAFLLIANADGRVTPAKYRLYNAFFSSVSSKPVMSESAFAERAHFVARNAGDALMPYLKETWVPVEKFFHAVTCYAAIDGRISEGAMNQIQSWYAMSKFA